jgi:hypothetical protein
MALVLVGCGGGGGTGSSNTTTPSASSNVAILTVNKDGLYTTYPFSTGTSYTQQTSSGYFSIPNYLIEWSGINFGYTNQYVMPTAGILQNASLTKGVEKMWSMSNLNYDASKVPPSTDSTLLPITALAEAVESKIYGGSNNDQSGSFFNTSEVDLAGGNDILIFTQNYSLYQFQRVVGSSTSVNVTRNGHSTLVKNVETFQFADGSKTLTDILSKLP